MNQTDLQQKTFLLLLAAVSVAFAFILRPFSGAIFWGMVLAILFTPFYRWMLGVMRQRRSLAALTTLLVCLIGVGIPLLLLTVSLLREGALLYSSILSRQIDFGAYFRGIIDALPPSTLRLLDELGLGNLAAAQEKLSGTALEASRIVALHALNIGQNAFGFALQFGVMLYLLFFLLRDGVSLVLRIQDALPLSRTRQQHLFGKFATVIRATVKGNLAIAATQGVLGGLMLWFLGIQGPLLWGVLMGLLSMVPAVGAAIMWLPIALYFLLIGSIWKGVTLIIFGVLVLGLVDNILRPLLVGKDTKMADYLVLISTIGGIAVFGLNGFVIGPVIAALFIATWDLFAADAALA